VAAPTVCVARDDLLRLLAGDLAGRRGRRYCVGATGVRVLHAPLWPLGDAGRSAHQTGTVAGPLRRANVGPRVGHRHRGHAVPAVRRSPVLRAVPAPTPHAGAARPRTGTLGAGHRIRVVPRPGDE